MRISDWSSDVCSSDLGAPETGGARRRAVRGAGKRQAAMADAQIDRRVKLRIVELVDHVRPDDAELCRAMRDEGRDVEGAHADQRDMRLVGREHQRAALGKIGSASRRERGCSYV